MKWQLASLAAAVTIASSCVAFAAPLPLVGDNVGGGSVSVTPCDSAFTPTYTTSAGNVTTVTVGGIADPACEGGRLKLTLLDGGTAMASGGTVTVPTDGDTTDNSVSVTVSPQPSATLIDEIAVVITGP